MKKTKVLIDIKKFLNKAPFHSNANISAYLTKNTYKEGDIPTFDAQLDIADCDRTIHISIDLNEYYGSGDLCKRQAKNSINKVKILAESLTKFYEALKAHEKEIFKAIDDKNKLQNS